VKPKYKINKIPDHLQWWISNVSTPYTHSVVRFAEWLQSTCKLSILNALDAFAGDVHNVFSYSCYLEMLHQNDHARIQGLFVSKAKRKKVGSVSPIDECALIKNLGQA
jgi:hypothetical protein